MNPVQRSTVVAASLAISLAVALGGGASAQVATLAGPDQTPEPEAELAQNDLAFADREEALLAFASCMRENGIAMDDPDVSGGGRGFFRDGQGAFDRQSDEFEAARTACGAILEASRPDIDPAAEQERLETQLQLAQCLRDNGYPEYPDPVVDADGRLQRGGRALHDLGIDRRSEAFRGAMSGCADELGLEQFGPGGGPRLAGDG